MNESNPYAPPKAKVGVAPVAALDEYRADIEKLAVSEYWKETFRVIESGGGVGLPQISRLTGLGRARALFNVLGFLLGPVYYLILGMWRKAFVLFGTVLFGVAFAGWLLSKIDLGQFASYLYFTGTLPFAFRANIDYYKRRVLGEDGWW